MTDPKNKAASRGEATGDANPKTASPNSSPRRRGKRIDVAKLRAALADPPSIPAMLDQLKHEQASPTNALAHAAAAARDDADRLEAELSAAFDAARSGDGGDDRRDALAAEYAAALAREIAALEDIVRAAGGGE